MMQNVSNRQYVPNSNTLMSQGMVGYSGSNESGYGSCSIIGGYTGLTSAHHGSYNLNLRLRPHDFSINNIAL